MTEMKFSEILENACDVLDERGWTQHEMENFETGEVCAFGAIRRAMHPTTLATGLISSDQFNFEVRIAKTMISLGLVKDDLDFHAPTAVTAYNDRVAESVDDIKDLFIATAKHYRDFGL